MNSVTNLHKDLIDALTWQVNQQKPNEKDEIMRRLMFSHQILEQLCKITFTVENVILLADVYTKALQFLQQHPVRIPPLFAEIFGITEQKFNVSLLAFKTTQTSSLCDRKQLWYQLLVVFKKRPNYSRLSPLIRSGQFTVP